MKLLSHSWNEVAGKKVIVRCNFDVPVEDGRVMDTTRIEGCGETLRKLLDYGCKLVLLGHMDRPGGYDESRSLRPVVDVLEQMLGETVGFVQEIDVRLVEDMPSRIVLMENLRFWSGEVANEVDFASKLADLGDFYVNESFANCHREHASMVTLAKLLPHAAGLHLEREIRVLSKVREEPEYPLVVVIGGAKLETKEPMVEAFKDRADAVLVGGKVASDYIKNPRWQSQRGRQKLKIKNNVAVAELKEDGMDITEKSAREFAKEILGARTVIWNGTMGVFEDGEHTQGTRIVAEAVDQTRAFTVVGGGDTEAALTELDLEHGIDHISSGGGAMLEFLVKGTLVGIEALG